MKSATKSVQASQYTGDTGIDALIDGVIWDAEIGGITILTYSFPTGTAEYGPAYGTGETRSFTALSSPAEQQFVRDALAKIAEVTNIQFIETTADDADIRIAYTELDPGIWGHAYLPRSTASTRGDIWIDTGQLSNFSTFDFSAILHEVGHAIGMKHPHSTTPLNNTTSDEPVDFSVMSYVSISGDFSSYQNPYPASMMLNDISSLQALYGANPNGNSGDTLYDISYFNNLSGDLANPVFLETIWDGGGNDTISWEGQASDATINLHPGTWSSIGGAHTVFDGLGTPMEIATSIAIARGTDIENAIGGNGNDILIGNSLDNVLSGNGGTDIIIARAGFDTVSGGDGDDILVGGSGGDTLIGGQGRDILLGNDNFAGGLDGDTDYFDFNNLDTTNLDFVVGFDSSAPGSGGDIIDLTDLFANLSSDLAGYDAGSGGLFTNDLVAAGNTIVGVNYTIGGTLGWQPVAVLIGISDAGTLDDNIFI